MKRVLAPRQLIQAAGVLLLFALPFGTKKFLFTFALPFSNFYISEYSSAFLFGSDIFLLAFVLFTLIALRREFLDFLRRQAPLLAFLAVALATVALAGLPALSFYTWARLALAALAALALAVCIREGVLPFRRAFAALAAAGVLQALLGIYQTTTNGDFGLRLFGEPVIGPLTSNVGHVWIENGEVLRAIGTFPHANIFAGFLIVGLGALYYLFLSRKDSRWPYGWLFSAASIPVVLVGLVVSFSRSGWITALALTLGVLIFGLVRKDLRHRAAELLVVLILVSLFLFLFLGWAIAPRAGFAPGEGSVTDRYAYDVIGIEMLGAHPLGVGPGNQLTTGVSEGRYAARNLSAWWLRQPIHNLYLMVGTETGIVGLALFFLFLGTLFMRAIRQGKLSPSGRSPAGREIGISAILLLALLLFGLFDHFLWDLQSGRLMLWMVIGLLMGSVALQAKGNMKS